MTMEAAPMNPAAMAMLNTMFTGIKDAKAQMDANYMRPGIYWSRINRVKVDVSRKQEAFVAIEMTAIHIIDDDDGKGHKLGEDVTHMLMPKHDMFLPNMKGFIAGALSMAIDDITEVEAMSVCGADQPLAGTVVECRNRTIITKEGRPFTVVKYVREVPASELLQALPPIDQENFFPGGALGRIAQLQAQQAQ